MSPIVMVNGCFDIIHVGHVKLLEYASYYGRVYVAINSDESVRRLKGEGRPRNCARDRAEVLQAIRHVTGVYVFQGDTPEDAIETLQPSVIVVGYDHSIRDAHYLQAMRREVAVVQAPRFGDHSTSRMLAKPA